MFLGNRAGVFSKKHNHIDDKDKDKEVQSKVDDELKTKFEIKYETQKVKKDEIVITRFPISLWCSSFIMITLGIILLYNQIVGPNSNAKLFTGLDNGAWWEYLTIILTILIGCSLLVSAKMEKIMLSKISNLLLIYNNNIFCSKLHYSIQLKNIKNIIHLSSSLSSGINILSYRIAIKFNDEIITCLESIRKRKVIMEVMKLRNFVFNINEKYEMVAREDRSNII